MTCSPSVEGAALLCWQGDSEVCERYVGMSQCLPFVFSSWDKSEPTHYPEAECCALTLFPVSCFLSCPQVASLSSPILQQGNQLFKMVLNGGTNPFPVSLLWQKYFLSQLRPAHLHPLLPNFSTVQLVPELPKLGAQAR